MAENITTTKGENTTLPANLVVAADDIGGVKYLRAKLTLGADGAADLDLDSGQQDMAGSLPVVIASNQSALPMDVTGQGDIPIATEGVTISQTPTITGGAYSANDAVGGLLTFANAARVSAGGGVIKDVIILDDAGQDAELELWLFNATFTAMTDNNAWAPSEADLRKLIAIITTEDGAWFAAGTPSAARVEVSQRYDLAGTSLFGQLVTRGTPSFAATDDVTIIIGLLQD